MADGNIDYEIIDIQKECCIASKENPNLSTPKLKVSSNNNLEIDINNKINNIQDMIVFSNKLIKEKIKDPKTNKIKQIKLVKDNPKNKMNSLFFENLRKLKADLFFTSHEKSNQIFSESVSDNFPYKTKISNYKNYKSFFTNENKDELPSNLITAIDQKSKKTLINNTKSTNNYPFSEKKINVVNLDSKKIPEKTKIIFPFERNLTNKSNYIYFLNFTDKDNNSILHRYNSSHRKIFFNNKNNKRKKINNYKTNSAKKYTFSSLRELYRNIKTLKTDFSLTKKHIRLKENKLIQKKKISNKGHLKELNIKKNSTLLETKIERSINLISLNEYNKKNQLIKNNYKIINRYELRENNKNSKKKTIHLSLKLNENGDKVILGKELKNRTNINILTLLELSKKKKNDS